MNCQRCGAVLASSADPCPTCGLVVRPAGHPAALPAHPPGAVLPERISGLGKALSVLFALFIAVDLLAVVTALHRKSVFERIIARAPVHRQEAELSDTVYAAVAVAQVTVVLAIIVVWLVWFYRARQNVERYGAAQRFTPGWAIGAWFVPFLNLARPKGIADDIARASDPSVPFEDWHIDRLKKPPIVALWWACWLVTMFVDRLVLRALDDQRVTSQPRLLVFEMIASVLEIIAAVLAILVVRMITTRQEQKNRLFMARLQQPAPSIASD